MRKTFNENPAHSLLSSVQGTKYCTITDVSWKKNHDKQLKGLCKVKRKKKKKLDDFPPKKNLSENWVRDYKGFLSMSRCSTHNLFSEMT